MSEEIDICYECEKPGRKYTLNYEDCVLCDDCAEENGVDILEHHPKANIRCKDTRDLFA